MTSHRRELFLTALVSLSIVVVLAAGAAWFYHRGKAILAEEMRSRLQTYAALAAEQFSPQALEDIHNEQDTRKASFILLIQQAERIRAHLPDVEYLYVMRKTDTPSMLAFVIENDMLRSRGTLDANGNGTIDPEEEVPMPGEPFDVTDIPAMQQAAFEGPVADVSPTHDQWGWWMSGYAPIRDAQGRAIAIIGVDMRAEKFMATTQRIVSPVLFASALIGLLLIVGGFLGFLWHRRLLLLQRIDAERRAMVTVASHKLGGPIATLRWWMELLQEGYVTSNADHLPKAQRELTHAIERLSEVTRNLQDAVQADGAASDFWQNLAEETAEEIRITSGND